MKRYSGATVREVMTVIRNEIGSDAVIVDNRRVHGGVEILAMSEAEYNAINAETSLSKPAPPPAPAITPPAELKPHIPTFQEAMDQRARQSSQEGLLQNEKLPNPFKQRLKEEPAYQPGSQFRKNQGLSAYSTQSSTDLAEPEVSTSEVRVSFSSGASPRKPVHTPVVEPTLEIEVIEAELVDEHEEPEPTGPVLPTADERFADNLRKAKTITEWSSQMLGDLHSMQDLIRRQILPHVSQSNVYAEMNQILAKAGFQRDICAQILSSLPGELAERRMDLKGINRWAENALVEQISVISSPEVWWGGRTVVAVVGSNGSGKTTSIAKLAARFVMANEDNGVNEIVLLSTDSEHEATMRNHADVLGIEFHVVEDFEDLDAAIRSLSYKRLILIDTPGIGYRHKRLPVMMQRLAKVSTPMKVMLVLNASSEAESLEAMTGAYITKAQEAGVALEDCIVTKLDESVRIGALISTMARHKLRLNYQSCGNGVLEDFSRGSALALVRQSMESYSIGGDSSSMDSSRDIGAQFDATRDKLLGNVSEMNDVLASIRREFKNAGFVESTRSIAALETGRKNQPYAKLIAEQKGQDQPVSHAKPDLLWAKNDYPVESAYFKLANPEGYSNLSPYVAQKGLTQIRNVN
jgi:flagellar biosynthesis protein FlhF